MSRRNQPVDPDEANGPCAIYEGDGPLIAAAIHNGHAVREEVRRYLALTDAERLREEDPFTESWTVVAPTRVVGTRSRFEVDLNRPRGGAVYLRPEQAWGLRVWKTKPPPSLVERSRRMHDAFYRRIYRLLQRRAKHYGRFLVVDFHSYNVRRMKDDPDDPARQPDVNVGTLTMDRRRWAPVVDVFIETLRSVDVLGRRLDVRENVNFFGGFFPQWIHTTFPDVGCAMAIEVKKFFMDEWTGKPDWDLIRAMRTAFEQTIPPTLAALQECPVGSE